MPTPDVNSPATPSLPPNTSVPPASSTDDPSLLQNGSQSLDPNPSPSNGRQSSEPDAISQGKEKAKAVMADTLNRDTSGPPSRTLSKSPTRANKSSTPVDAAATNHSSPSRKRSRSGSRIDHDTPTKALNGPTTCHLLMDQYVTRDQMHASAVHRDQEHMRELFDQLRVEKDALTEYEMYRRQARMRLPTQPIYPSQRRRPGNRKTGELRMSRKERAAQAERLEELVPIRLDIEHEKFKLRDTFTWNVYDRVVPPHIFAQGLVEDFRIPPEASQLFTQQVYDSIREQIEDFHPHVFLDEDALDPHLPYTAYKNDELRIAVKLNITIGQHTLVDSFDWDINDTNNSPEKFSHQMAEDLCLSGEFTTAIAHSIREQTQLFTKGLFVSGHTFDGRPVDDADVRDNLLPSPLPYTFRPFFNAKEFSPYLYELNDADLERQELVFSREQRQQKRSAVNRKGGPSLPDLKDRLKTWRTSIVSSTIPGAAETQESSGLLRLPRTERRGGRGRWNRARGDEEDDEDLMESEESEIDSPMRTSIPSGGTNRTRAMQRGAASAAQAAMRANLARSATPEMALHHHDSRPLPRRIGALLEYDENDERALLRLKLPREKFRQWWRDWKAGKVQRKFTTPSQTPHLAPQFLPPTGQPPNPSQPQIGSANSTPRMGHAPGPPGMHAGSMMGPPPQPTTPRMMAGGLPPHMHGMKPQHNPAMHPQFPMGPGAGHFARPNSIDPSQLTMQTTPPGGGPGP